MFPAPDRIIACPHCKGLAKYTTIVSGNTFGARVWTDGKRLAPMLPQAPAIVKCRYCTKCYWLSKAKEVGTIDWWGDEGQLVDPAWTAAPDVQEPSEEEYYQALEQGLAKKGRQERDLRVLAWWRRNDVFREASQAEDQGITTQMAKFRKNLESLIRLLDESDETDCLMKAEALRELGEFESAKEVLRRVTSDEYTPVICQLTSLCDAGDTCVRELQFGD